MHFVFIFQIDKQIIYNSNTKFEIYKLKQELRIKSEDFQDILDEQIFHMDTSFLIKDFLEDC